MNKTATDDCVPTSVHVLPCLRAGKLVARPAPGLGADFMWEQLDDQVEYEETELSKGVFRQTPMTEPRVGRQHDRRVDSLPRQHRRARAEPAHGCRRVLAAARWPDRDGAAASGCAHSHRSCWCNPHAMRHGRHNRCHRRRARTDPAGR